MGGNMVLRLVVGSPDGGVKGTHRVVGYARDRNPDLEGVANVSLASSIEAMVRQLKPPRAIWVMVPAGNATESVTSELAELLSPGDLIIDGGNSHYKDSVRRGEGLAKRQIGFLDVGTSGGIWGRQEGYCMMVGGLKDHVDIVRAIFDTLAPPDGWAHVGPGGSGHFTKMIHNGIEYGLMEAYAEGLFETENDLRGIQPYVEDSGEGRWTIHAAMEADAPVPVIAAALFARFASRDPVNFSARFAAGLRNQFGGHTIQRADAKKIESTGEVKS